MVVIRKAREDDEKAVRKIHKAAIEAGSKAYYRPEQIRVWATSRGDLPFGEILKQTVFLVLELEGKVVAFCSMDLRKSAIVALFVSPLYKGRGFGTRLLNEQEKIGRENGLTQLSIDSSLNAVYFYQKRGYRRGADIIHTEPDGTQIECIRMSKGL